MEHHYVFSEDEAGQIAARFGEPFYERAAGVMSAAAVEWQLEYVELIPSYSANLVLKCRSALFGDVILKIGSPAFNTVDTEWRTLRHYKDQRFCRAIAVNLEQGTLLQERVHPGTTLREEQSLATRLAVFCSLHRGLHRAAPEGESYPSYHDWVNRMDDYMRGRADCPELGAYMAEAAELYRKLEAEYSRKWLLHGDFHHDNMLLGPSGQYVLIDPKGVIGDPVFDIPRFLINEFDEDVTPSMSKRMLEAINGLSAQLRIPALVLKQCMFVEMALAACWTVEGGASPETMSRELALVEFAKSLPVS